MKWFTDVSVIVDTGFADMCIVSMQGIPSILHIINNYICNIFSTAVGIATA